MRRIAWDGMQDLNHTNPTERRGDTRDIGSSEFYDSNIVGCKRHRPIRATTVFAFIAFAFNLSACGGPESAYLIGASLANFIHTDRVPIDYVAEYASGQECNLLKSIEDGGPLCRKSFTRTVIEPPLYCYRTIGEPNCYVSPDPYKTGAQTIR